MLSRKRRLVELVNKHVGFVERVLRNLGVPEAELDDAVQRTFIVVSNRLDDIQVGSEKSFVFKSAKYVAAHVWRGRAQRGRFEPLEDEMPSLQQSPEELTERKRARELLDEVLERMGEDLRVVFCLYEFEDFTMQEISQILDIPAGTVASRLRRARQQFKKHVQWLESETAPPLQQKVGS